MAAERWTDARSAAGRHSPWLIVGVISLATFMEVLDTSIANVALTHVAGGLAVSNDEATWVITSYLVANAIVIPISGWLSDVVGRKRYYMISVALFTGSSLLCGLSPNLQMLIFARILQGIGGGGLAPSEQSFLTDTFPPKKRGVAFAAYAVVVVCGPVLGPTLGGVITDNFSWHWIFLINVPVGIISLILVQLLVAEPELLHEERRARRRRGLKVDYIGFALVVVGLGCLEVTLDRGQREDWFDSGFITTTAILSGVALVALVIRELTIEAPIVNLRLLRNRNFAVSCLVMMTAGVIIFGSTQLIPQLLQDVLDYSATDAGVALTTGGLATIILMPAAGLLTGRVDTRVLLFPALACQALALWNMSGLNSEISFGDASQARLLQSMALPFLFVPVNVAAYVGLPQKDSASASALLNVARNLGGTFGISAAQTILAQRQQVHQSQLVEGLNPLNPAYAEGLGTIGGLVQGNPAADAMTGPLAVLYQQVGRQAMMLSFLDVFHVLMVFIIIVTPLTLILRQGKAGGR